MLAEPMLAEFLTVRSTIGANVFLMQSVPAHSLVIYEEKQLSILSKTARKKADSSDWTI